MDYEALRAALAQRDGADNVTLLDYRAVEECRDVSVRSVRRLFGSNAALAFMGFQRRLEYDTVFTNAENVALPLSLLFRSVSERPRHVTIAHRPSAKKKGPFYRALQLHKQMDVIFVYASRQLAFARDVLGIPESSLRLISFHADHRFFRPLDGVAAREEQVCSAGLEWRDYPTLIDALADHTDLCVRLAAASPWSKHDDETRARVLPPHIDARRYDYHGLRQLYAESSIVVVPLYENDFQAGITTILEAMSMGKPVVVTSTSGQNDVIVHGENGLYVKPGESDGWRLAIAELRGSPALRDKLGRNARKWLEENATLDRWVSEVISALDGYPAGGQLAPPSSGTDRGELPSGRVKPPVGSGAAPSTATNRY
jgi:glycosyltransferase involved in cell wall biosynthesis